MLLMTEQHIGDRIWELRIRRGLSQGQLATSAWLSRIYVQKLELGERASPSFPVQERLARALDVELRIDLVERSRARTPSTTRTRRG
jgi:transcriptional regulator with XRE-family HTH domain